jgi:hypothetical protein
MKKFVKRLLSVVLVCVMLGVALPLASVPAVAAGDYGSNGEFLAPIEEVTYPSISTAISSRAQLESIRNNLNGRYYLTADIDLSGAEWVPIGSSDAPFKGFFDGQGHVIKNLKITGTGYEHNGLFGYVTTGSIQNVGLEDTYINIASSYSSSFITAGGIRGYGSSLGYHISNCYNSGYISISSSSNAHVYSGGISGIHESGSIKNCYNIGDIVVSAISPSSAWTYAGGIYGGCRDKSYGNYVEYCYNSGDVSANSYAVMDGIKPVKSEPK